jgi:hypothetical protein
VSIPLPSAIHELDQPHQTSNDLIHTVRGGCLSTATRTGLVRIAFFRPNGYCRLPRNMLAPQVAGEIHEVTGDDLF